jgi:hypothetical protein
MDDGSAPSRAIFMLRMLQKIRLCSQAFSTVLGSSMQHDCDTVKLIGVTSI